MDRGRLGINQTRIRKREDKSDNQRQIRATYKRKRHEKGKEHKKKSNDSKKERKSKAERMRQREAREK